MSDLVEAYLEHLEDIRRSPETVRQREAMLYRLDADLPHGIEEASTAELQRWLGRRQLSPWTAWTYYHGIIDAYHWWSTDGPDPFDWDPSADLIRPPHPDTLPDPVTDDELAEALAHSDDWWQLVILLAALGAMRCAEICQLDRDDCTEDTIRIRRGKGGRARVVDTHPDLWQRLAPLPPGPVIRGRRTGRELDSKYLTNQARIHFDRLDMPYVHLHRFRHWAGTTAQRLTGNIRVTQEVLGHRSIQSTQGYTLVAGAERRSAVHGLRIPGRDAPAGTRRVPALASSA